MSAICNKLDFFLLDRMELDGNTDILNSLTVLDICKILDITRSTAMRRIKRMLEEGLLDYGLPELKGTKTYYLTEKGIEELNSLRNLLTRN